MAVEEKLCMRKSLYREVAHFVFAFLKKIDDILIEC